MRFLLILLTVAAMLDCAAGAEPFTLRDAILMAVQTHPSVGEAAANRRATEAELRQQQGTLLPQIRIEANAGPERTNQRDAIVPPINNNKWVAGSEASIVLRQLLFDGFTSINEIWRQAARVNGAAARVHERSGLAALDAAEAYIDVVRYTRLVALARENLAAHQRIASNVESRFRGGRAGEGDLEETRERVESARAALEQFRQNLDEARGKFRKSVGTEPYNLRVPGRLPNLPVSKDQALAVTLTKNPTIRAAQADVDAAHYAFRSTAGAFLPTVSLEARATEGNDTDNFVGHFSQESVKAVASWNIFSGGQDGWKRAEAAERYTEETMRHARLQREAFESIDKAWAARTITNDRIAALVRQIAADKKVIVAYGKEYDLGQRSLIDLLNAENQLFNAQVALESAKGVAVFADYQLLAAMGKLLEYVKAPHSIDAEPLKTASYGLIPYTLPPIITKLPNRGPDPANVAHPAPAAAPLQYAPMQKSQKSESFMQRWAASVGQLKPNNVTDFSGMKMDSPIGPQSTAINLLSAPFSFRE
ncbi:MAG TPA: TolC family outer membrane protein [Pseudolabrys sp.]|jgi:adhesin transport system outer membrane protein|nr:TolC family outer membrane protein [Pseudolabrys sp.]